MFDSFIITEFFQHFTKTTGRICSPYILANVEVHLRRTLCDVRWNVLLAPIIHRLFPASAQNRFRAVVAVRIAPVEGPLVVQSPYILSPRQGSGDGPRAVRITNAARNSHRIADKLWAVAWNPLLDRKCFISCPFSAPWALEIEKMA